MADDRVSVKVDLKNLAIVEAVVEALKVSGEALRVIADNETYNPSCDAEKALAKVRKIIAGVKIPDIRWPS